MCTLRTFRFVFLLILWNIGYVIQILIYCVITRCFVAGEKCNMQDSMFMKYPRWKQIHFLISISDDNFVFFSLLLQYWGLGLWAKICHLKLNTKFFKISSASSLDEYLHKAFFGPSLWFIHRSKTAILKTFSYYSLYNVYDLPTQIGGFPEQHELTTGYYLIHVFSRNYIYYLAVLIVHNSPFICNPIRNCRATVIVAK